MVVQEPVQAAVWHCLNHYNYEDAIFLSERLFAETSSYECLYLLATAYYRNNQKAQAYQILKEKYFCSSQCQLLFAICAFDLEKYAEAEWAILRTESHILRNLDDIITDYGDQASFVLLLLGKIVMKTERKSKAVECWRKAVKINPFLYSAFELLCKIGEKPNPNAIFQTENIENVSFCHGNTQNLDFYSNNNNAVVNNSTQMDKIEYSTPNQMIIMNNKTTKDSTTTPDESPLAVSLPLSGFMPLTKSKHKARSRFELQSPAFGYFNENPSAEYIGTPNFTAPSPINYQSLAKRLKSQREQHRDSFLEKGNNKPVLSQSSNVPIIKITSSPLNNQPNPNIRRSSRLFSSSSVKENNKSPGFVTPNSPTRKTKTRLTKNQNNNNNNNKTINEINNKVNEEKSETVTTSSEMKMNNNLQNFSEAIFQQQKQSIDGLMALLRIIGQAVSALSSYNCNSAIQHLKELSPNQFNTSWVQGLMGVAYFEMNDYENCVKYFELVHAQDPQRLDYMDIYSSALWHLQKEVTLSALAQDLINTNKTHPITWCVNGNCFSLHKEHDIAIKFFQRAVQVDGNCFYAYTLLGHEYITTEELDKAMSCFLNAVRINPRHYNAWFGLGTIYSKQERYNLSEFNYMKALTINPTSSVILCHIGIVQHALKQPDKALSTLTRAISNEPNIPLCKFHRASVYFAVGRHAEALKEFEELKTIVPTESSVYYLIGKVHKKLGNTDLALQHFSLATDLDPKGASSQIKEAFDHPTIAVQQKQQQIQSNNEDEADNSEEFHPDILNNLNQSADTDAAQQMGEELSLDRLPEYISEDDVYD